MASGHFFCADFQASLQKVSPPTVGQCHVFAARVKKSLFNCIQFQTHDVYVMRAIYCAQQNHKIRANLCAITAIS